jgi:hypothetical protein
VFLAREKSDNSSLLSLAPLPPETPAVARLSGSKQNNTQGSMWLVEVTAEDWQGEEDLTVSNSRKGWAGQWCRDLKVVMEVRLFPVCWAREDSMYPCDGVDSKYSSDFKEIQMVVQRFSA